MNFRKHKCKLDKQQNMAHAAANDIEWFLDKQNVICFQCFFRFFFLLFSIRSTWSSVGVVVIFVVFVLFFSWWYWWCMPLWLMLLLLLSFILEFKTRRNGCEDVVLKTLSFAVCTYGIFLQQSLSPSYRYSQTTTSQLTNEIYSMNTRHDDDDGDDDDSRNNDNLTSK